MENQITREVILNLEKETEKTEERIIIEPSRLVFLALYACFCVYFSDSVNSAVMFSTLSGFAFLHLRSLVKPKKEVKAWYNNLFPYLVSYPVMFYCFNCLQVIYLSNHNANLIIAFLIGFFADTIWNRIKN